MQPNSEMVRLAYSTTTRAAKKEEDRYVDVVASTESIDAHGEIVEQSWRLERYAANPVVLYGHEVWTEQRPEDTLPIGHAENVRIEDGALKARLFFVDQKANPLAEKVYQSMRQGSLRAVSVGFMPNEVRLEKRDGRDVYVLADNELMEISVVAIPANPDAVAESRAKAIASLRAKVSGSHTEGPQERNMKRIAKALGLHEAAGEDDVIGRLDEMKKGNATLLEALEAKDLNEGLAAAKHLAFAKSQLAEQKKKIEEIETKAQRAEIEKFLDDSKVTPAQRPALLDIGLMSIEKMKAVVATLPKSAAAPGGASAATVAAGGEASDPATALLDEADLAFCKSTGADPTTFAAFKAKKIASLTAAQKGRF